jgi:hypothetical protein
VALSRKTGVFLALQLLAAAALFPVLSAVAHAAPRTIEDCEKIEAADAYNKCLAQFGPAAHEHALSHVAPQGRQTFQSSRRHHRSESTRQSFTRGRNVGRQRMEFTISPRRGRH